MTKWEKLKIELGQEIKKETQAVKASIKSNDLSNALGCKCELQALDFVLNSLMPKIEKEII
jgi:hypothetical protein